MTMTPEAVADSIVRGTVETSELVAGLTAVLPHAGTNMTLPMLCSVKFETRDGRLFLVTTDRYSLATYSLEWDGPDVDALLPAASAKELLSVAKKAPKYAARVSLHFEERSVEYADLDRRTTLPLDTDHEFVKWAAIMPSEESLSQETGRISAMGINPAQLAKFAKGAPKGVTMRLIFGATSVKPVLVKIGDNFVGLIMPVRLPDTDN